MLQRKQLGIAVVGSGRIGTMRARAAIGHPSVNFVAVSDLDAANAEKLSREVGAQIFSGNNREVIAHPDVSTVIVSTSEGEHLEPVLQAIDHLATGKRCELPTPREARTTLEATLAIQLAAESSKIVTLPLST